MRLVPSRRARARRRAPNGRHAGCFGGCLTRGRHIRARGDDRLRVNDQDLHLLARLLARELGITPEDCLDNTPDWVIDAFLGRALALARLRGLNYILAECDAASRTHPGSGG